MSGYNLLSLKDMIEQLGEDRVTSILSDFSCPLNPDVENFLTKRSARDFASQNIAPTQLVFASYKGEQRLIGYFTVTIKDFYIQKDCLSQTLRRRISRFCDKYSRDDKGYRIAAPLIAQLGKNYKDGLNKLITGDELLQIACDKVALAQRTVGGKIIYLECEDKPKLLEFYGSNGFVNFGKRSLDKDETGLTGNYLIQMLKYM